MSRKKTEYKVNIIQGDKPITEKDKDAIREIMVDIIVKHINKYGFPQNEITKK